MIVEVKRKGLSGRSGKQEQNDHDTKRDVPLIRPIEENRKVLEEV